MANTKQVIILGAGASRALRFITRTLNVGGGVPDETKRIHSLNGPLSAGFFYDANEFSKETRNFSHFPEEFKIYSDWLTKFVEKYYFEEHKQHIRFQELFTNEGISRRLNIEKLYSAIEDEFAKFDSKKSLEEMDERELLGFSDAWHGKDDFINYVFRVLSIISYYCFSLYHRVLAHYVTQRNAQVISFNWDILFDEEMFRTKKWDYGDGYGFSPTGILDKSESLRLKRHHYSKTESPSTNLILKPHGSINWYRKFDWREEYDYESGEIYLGVPLTHEGALRGGTISGQGALQFHERNDRENVSYESLLLPPGKKRKRFEFIWRKVKEILAEADEITAIGFSFNSFDRHIPDEISSVPLKKNLSVNVISPEDGIEERYKLVFPTATISREHQKFSDYCRWIVNQPGMEMFREIEKEMFAPVS